MSSAAMAHLLQLGRPDATPRLPATAEAVTLTPPLSHDSQQDGHRSQLIPLTSSNRFMLDCQHDATRSRPDNYPPIDPTEPVPDDPGPLSPDIPETLPPASVEPMPGLDDPDSVPAGQSA